MDNSRAHERPTMLQFEVEATPERGANQATAAFSLTKAQSAVVAAHERLAAHNCRRCESGLDCQTLHNHTDRLDRACEKALADGYCAAIADIMPVGSWEPQEDPPHADIGQFCEGCGRVEGTMDPDFEYPR
jgi:hypothetical protein